MSLASRTREAVRSHPFLYDGLRAGVVNYTAAARFLDLGADDQDTVGQESDEPSVADAPEEAVVAALRRYAEDLPEYESDGTSARVSMESGLGDGDPADALLTVGDTALVPGGGQLTGILATGDVDATALAHVLTHLRAEDVAVTAAGVGGDALLVVVERRAGADAVRAVEAALETTPATGD
ncbi:hypothetical protein SAMN05216388_100675 [Halorientalis persicus]|jgi:hypothetical protein|uniref:Uncharacterized protein n=1 Tax=Halorientalis persicus TaxID=1367881 RepID=A0A1H8KII9_9EURY|nr:hypothetical protein [Halorientalis persicus]SEN92769.1 hypothetical protein SAMN05216388_100675 [Halorientalis persicus]